MVRENKGITLIALTITIIILLILASITTYSGISTIKSSKLNKFKQELEIMQSEVQVLYEKYKDEETIDVGKEISGSGKEEQAEIAFDGAEETNTSGYRLFDAEEIEKLGIDGIERDYLLDIMNKKVISLEPFEQDGVAYYTLEQIPGTNKNTIDEKIERGRVNFSVNTKEVTNGWEVTVSNIEYSKYVGKGKILYQKIGSNNWTTLVDDFKGNTYTFVLESEGEYNIKIIDAAGIEKTTENPITIGALGNYLLDETTYYDTLQEAVDAASNGSTIKVVKNVSESGSTAINKEIILDTNGKNINMSGPINIHANVTIQGEGTIQNTISSNSISIDKRKCTIKKY